MTHVYIANVLPLNDEDFEEKYLSLHQESQKRVDRKKNKREVNQSLYAYLLLEYALAKHGVFKFSLALNGHGKPYLEGRKDMFFNLSHSYDRVMCVISDGEVGCDVQQIMPIETGLAERFFSPDEAKKVENECDFYRFWTAKESVAKAKGVPLMAVCKTPLDICAADMHVMQFECDGYSYAVCAEKDGFSKAKKVRL